MDRALNEAVTLAGHLATPTHGSAALTVGKQATQARLAHHQVPRLVDFMVFGYGAQISQRSLGERSPRSDRRPHEPARPAQRAPARR
jgi:hypothetical protein